MVTIKDIARAAGVAQGTVSNVLNRRGNVSSEKIRLVLEACEQLGYVPNERAKILRRGQANLLGVLMPNLTDKSCLDFYTSFRACAEAHQYVVRLYLRHFSGQNAEENAIQEARSDMVRGLAVFSTEYLRQKEAPRPEPENMRLLYVERHPFAGTDYIGFDYRQAGQDIARRVMKKAPRRLLLVTGNLRYSNEADFFRGFSRETEGTGVQVTALHIHHDREHISLLQTPEIAQADAVICSRIELADAARDILSTFYKGKMPDIYTISPLYTLPENSYIKYELNYRQLGDAAAHRMIARLESTAAPEERLLENTGFRSWSPAPMRASGSMAPINMITLDSPAAYIARDMSRLYTQETGIPVNITIYSYDETYEIFNNLRKGSSFDVIRLDVSWMSWFAEKLLLPLGQLSPGIDKELTGFLPGLLERFCYVNGVPYALPGSPSTQMLFYRTDLFTDAMCRRIFREQYGRELDLPGTFEEFNHIAAFFTRRLNPDSPVEYGATITLGSTGVAGSEYLARLFSLQEHLYGPDGEIRLNSPDCVRALKLLLELRQYTAPEYCPWWTSTAQAFAGGNVAMAILYNNFAAPLVGYHSRVQDSIGYAMIPGGNPCIGGGALGVSRYSRQPEQALHFIRWLCSEPVASASTLFGGVSPCSASYDNYSILNSYPWLNLARSCFIAARGQRVPPQKKTPFDERRFMSIVGMAVKNAYSGALSPQAAMDYAQQLMREQFADIF